MDGDEGLAAEVAALIRESKADLVTAYVALEAERYGAEVAPNADAAEQVAWVYGFVEAIADELVGKIDRFRYLTCMANMVSHKETVLQQISVFAEAELAYMRVLAPLVWNHYCGCDQARGRAALTLLESTAWASIRANTVAFLDTIDRPGSLISTWSTRSADAQPAMAGSDAVAGIQGPAAGEPRDSAFATRAVEVDLTQRERQILDLILKGLANKEIASRLGIKEGTVKNSVGRLFDKFAVTSRAELIIKAIRREESDIS